MFGSLFNKNKIFDRKRPIFYEGIVSKEEYETILQMSEQECVRLGKIIYIQAGTIKVKSTQDGEEIAFHLDNLVRKCHHAEEQEWPTIIKNHFSRYPIDKSKAKFLAKDFGYARPYLKVLVRTIKDIPEGMVYQLDIPNTSSFLILDYDERFHFLMEKDIQEWSLSKKELFEIGLANISVEKIDIQEVLWADKYELFSFFSGDFSASFMLELAKNAPFSIGNYGAIVAIPTKGSAFVHPINTHTIEGFINAFDETFVNFHKEDEVPISECYYWYYNREFRIIETSRKDNKINIKLPRKLRMLME